MNSKLATRLLSAMLQILLIADTVSKSAADQPEMTTDSSNTDDAYATSFLNNTDEPSEELPCEYAFGLSLGNRERELHCCKQIVKRYEFFWAGRSLPLNRYLATLKGWNCPQYRTVCDQRLFGFNDFTNLMYDYFCNYTNFVSECLPIVTSAIDDMQTRINPNLTSSNPVPRHPNSLINTLGWENLLSQIEPSKMTLDELLEPCIQVAQYDQEKVHDGSYQEVIDFGIPSCNVAWCGFGEEALNAHHISIWTCLSPR